MEETKTLAKNSLPSSQPDQVDDSYIEEVTRDIGTIETCLVLYQQSISYDFAEHQPSVTKGSPPDLSPYHSRQELLDCINRLSLHVLGFFKLCTHIGRNDLEIRQLFKQFQQCLKNIKRIGHLPTPKSEVHLPPSMMINRTPKLAHNYPAVDAHLQPDQPQSRPTQLPATQNMEQNTRLVVSDPSSEDILKPLRGWLLKQGERGIIRSWKKRYFVQDQMRLKYFPKNPGLQSTAGSLDTSLGFIDLNDISTIKTMHDSTRRFDLVTSYRVYHLQTVEDGALSYWISGIETALERRRKFLQQHSSDPFPSSFSSSTSLNNRIQPNKSGSAQSTRSMSNNADDDVGVFSVDAQQSKAAGNTKTGYNFLSFSSFFSSAPTPGTSSGFNSTVPIQHGFEKIPPSKQSVSAFISNDHDSFENDNTKEEDEFSEDDEEDSVILLDSTTQLTEDDQFDDIDQNSTITSVVGTVMKGGKQNIISRNVANRSASGRLQLQSAQFVPGLDVGRVSTVTGQFDYDLFVSTNWSTARPTSTIQTVVGQLFNADVVVTESVLESNCFEADHFDTSTTQSDHRKLNQPAKVAAPPRNKNECSGASKVFSVVGSWDFQRLSDEYNEHAEKEESEECATYLSESGNLSLRFDNPLSQSAGVSFQELKNTVNITASKLPSLIDFQYGANDGLPPGLALFLLDEFRLYIFQSIGCDQKHLHFENFLSYVKEMYQRFQDYELYFWYSAVTCALWALVDVSTGCNGLICGPPSFLWRETIEYGLDLPPFSAKLSTAIKCSRCQNLISGHTKNLISYGRPSVTFNRREEKKWDLSFLPWEDQEVSWSNWQSFDLKDCTCRKCPTPTDISAPAIDLEYWLKQFPQFLVVDDIVSKHFIKVADIRELHRVQTKELVELDPYAKKNYSHPVRMYDFIPASTRGMPPMYKFDPTIKEKPPCYQLRAFQLSMTAKSTPAKIEVLFFGYGSSIEKKWLRWFFIANTKNGSTYHARVSDRVLEALLGIACEKNTTQSKEEENTEAPLQRPHRTVAEEGDEDPVVKTRMDSGFQFIPPDNVEDFCAWFHQSLLYDVWKITHMFFEKEPHASSLPVKVSFSEPTLTDIPYQMLRMIPQSYCYDENATDNISSLMNLITGEAKGTQLIPKFNLNASKSKIAYQVDIVVHHDNSLDRATTFHDISVHKTVAESLQLIRSSLQKQKSDTQTETLFTFLRTVPERLDGNEVHYRPLSIPIEGQQDLNRTLFECVLEQEFKYSADFSRKILRQWHLYVLSQPFDQYHSFSNPLKGSIFVRFFTFFGPSSVLENSLVHLASCYIDPYVTLKEVQEWLSSLEHCPLAVIDQLFVEQRDVKLQQFKVLGDRRKTFLGYGVRDGAVIFVENVSSVFENTSDKSTTTTDFQQYAMSHFFCKKDNSTRTPQIEVFDEEKFRSLELSSPLSSSFRSSTIGLGDLSEDILRRIFLQLPQSDLFNLFLLNKHITKAFLNDQMWIELIHRDFGQDGRIFPHDFKDKDKQSPYLRLYVWHSLGPWRSFLDQCISSISPSSSNITLNALVCAKDMGTLYGRTKGFRPSSTFLKQLSEMYSATSRHCYRALSVQGKKFMRVTRSAFPDDNIPEVFISITAGYNGKICILPTKTAIVVFLIDQSQTGTFLHIPPMDRLQEIVDYLISMNL